MELSDAVLMILFMAAASGIVGFCAGRDYQANLEARKREFHNG